LELLRESAYGQLLLEMLSILQKDKKFQLIVL